MKPTKNYGLSDSLIDAVRKSVEEALVGGQKKLDVDKDGKLEKSDFASLRAKKDAVDTKPKLKEDHPDEKEDKALIKKLIKKADVSDDEEDKALIKKTMKKEEVEIEEENKFLDSAGIKARQHAKYPDASDKEKDLINRGLGHIVHNARNPNGPQAKSMPKKRVNEETAGETYEDALGHLKKANAAKEGSQGYHYHMSNHHEAMGHWHASKGRNLSAKKEFNKAEAHHELGDDLKEEVEQIDEAPLRAVNALVGYPKLNKKIAAKGTPGSEDERNKAAAGLKKSRSGLGPALRNGTQHYDVRREDVEQMDELSVHKMLRYTDASNKNREVLNKKWDTGTATEREKNKVLSHEKGADRASTRIKAKTGKYPNEIGKSSRMKYAITKEDIEQMDELSRGTLKSYVKKAGKSAQHYSFEPSETHPESGHQYRPTYTKRVKGINIAKDKLKREESEQMDEVKLADLPRRKVVGKSYGADYVDPEGADETAADMKKAEPKRKSDPQGTMKRRFIKDKSKLRMQYK